MAQHRIFDSSGTVDKESGTLTNRHRLRSLGDEDQILRVDPYYEKWYEYDEAADPQLPPDFTERLGIHIIVLMERHTLQEAISKISELLERHIRNPKMYLVFFKTLRLFLHQPEALNYLNSIWSSLLVNRKLASSGQPHINEILSWLYQDFLTNRNRNFYRDSDDLTLTFSFLAVEIGDNLICLNELTSGIDNIRNLYSLIIAMVLEDLDITQELSNKNSTLIRGDYKKSYSQAYFERYLFNDIFQYIEYRALESGQKQYTALGISHHTDNIKHLVKNLTAIRSQVVQSIINSKTTKRNEEIREKLKKRSLTDEGIIASTPIFRNVLRLFYMENRYRFDYIGMDLVRNFARVFSILVGFSAVLYSFLDTSFMSLHEGIIIFATMCVFSLVVFPRKYFKNFYPRKYTADLKKNISEYLLYFHKMSREQLLQFGEQQIKSPENREYFYLIPELILYIHNFPGSQTEKLATNTDVYYTANYLQQICDEQAQQLHRD